MAEGTKIGSIYYDLSLDDAGFVKATQRVDQNVKNLEGKFSGAEKSSKIFAGALLGVAGAALGVVTASTLTAARTETLGVAMNAVARATGTSTKLLEEQEAKLKKQGITTQEARQTLILFMQAQLDVADASKIARVAQDLAVIGNMNSSEATNILTEAISSQQVLMLRQFGIVTSQTQIFEEYAATVGKTADDLTEMERRQAFVNKILQEGTKVAGTYEAAMGTAGKQLGSLPRYIQEAANAIGEVFLPAFSDGIRVVTDFFKAINVENVEKFRKELEKYPEVIIILAGAITGALTPAIWGAVTAIGALMIELAPFIIAGLLIGAAVALIVNAFRRWEGSTDALNQVIGALGYIFRTYLLPPILQLWDSIRFYLLPALEELWSIVSQAVVPAVKIVAGVIGGLLIAAIVDAIRWVNNLVMALAFIVGVISGLIKAVAGFFGIQIKEGVKSNEAVTKSTEKNAAKQLDAVKKSNAGQVASGGQKTKDLKKQLDREEKDFELSMKKREATFKQSLADLVFAHQDKITSLKEQITDENDDFSENMADRTETFNETMTDFKEAHEEKVLAIEEQIADEVAKGDEADATKLEKLKEQLAKEIAEYDKNVLEKEAKQKKEDEKLLERHNKQVADYQAEVDAEQAILNAHQEQVNMVKDKAREDDIARLIRQHEEEKAEATAAHEQKMIDMKEQGAAQGAAGGAAFKGETDKAMEDTKKIVDNATKDMGEKMAKNLADGAKKAGEDMVKNFINSIKDMAKKAVSWSLQNYIPSGNPFLSPLVDFSKLGNFFAGGVNNFAGGWAVVGEQGPELLNLPRGTDVLPNDVSENILRKSGSGANIYIDQMVVRDDTDVAAIGREIGFRAGLQPR